MRYRRFAATRYAAIVVSISSTLAELVSKSAGEEHLASGIDARPAAEHRYGRLCDAVSRVRVTRSLLAGAEPLRG
jgi:hypothetical protein